MNNLVAADSSIGICTDELGLSGILHSPGCPGTPVQQGTLGSALEQGRVQLTYHCTSSVVSKYDRQMRRSDWWWHNTTEVAQFQITDVNAVMCAHPMLSWVRDSPRSLCKWLCWQNSPNKIYQLRHCATGKAEMLSSSKTALEFYFFFLSVVLHPPSSTV